MCACKATTTITTQLGPGDLVSIHSLEENTFVKKLATADIWLGGRDWFYEGKWEGSDGSENSIFDETGTNKVWTKPTFSAADANDWLYMTSGIFLEITTTSFNYKVIKLICTRGSLDNIG